MSEHIQTIRYVMETITAAGLTMNPDKCTIASNKIHIWCMIFSSDGMQPNSTKVDALNFISAPTNKDDFNSFLCVMQSNSDYIKKKNFLKKAAPLAKLTHGNANFEWSPIHQNCFENLLQSFKNDTSLSHFDTKKKIFIITYARYRVRRNICTRMQSQLVKTSGYSI